MASLPMEFHLKGLIDTLKLGDRMDDVVETMISLYTQGDTGTFWPLFRAVLPNGEEDKAGYAAFEQAMIVERNKTMIKSAEPIIDAGQRLHRGRRAAPAGPGRADRASQESRPYRHCRQLTQPFTQSVISSR